MKDRVILDLCGGTGAWSRPYREAGYDVRVITLPDYDVTDVVFADDYIVFNKQNYTVNDMGIEYSDVYGILSAPPCTEFSIAKGNANRDFEGAMKIVQACLNIIWQCRIHGNLKFWALENPVGFLRQFLGIPRFTFKQWQFGEMKVKKTDIWGYFNFPVATVRERPERVNTCIGKKGRAIDWAKAEVPPEYEFLNELPYKERRAAVRAITPPGFAEAFYKANR